MKIENQKVSDCRVRLVISAGAEETAEDYGTIYRQLLRDVRAASPEVRFILLEPFLFRLT